MSGHFCVRPLLSHRPKTLEIYADNMQMVMKILHSLVVANNFWLYYGFFNVEFYVKDGAFTPILQSTHFVTQLP